MDYIFDDWKKILDDFRNSVSKDLAEIHKQKAEVQRIKTEIFEHIDTGKYVRHNERLILSAPEIVIGNVDKCGDLIGSGRIVLRGNQIDLDGVGTDGSIRNRATTISQTAVDPGVDGNEEVVYPKSAVITQARAITLESHNATDVFSEQPAVPANGIRIHADSTLDLDASVSSTRHKANVENRQKSLKQQQDELKKTADTQMKDIEKYFSSLKKLMDDKQKLMEDPLTIRSSVTDMETLNQQIYDLLPALHALMIDFIHVVSRQAEATRQTTALDKEKQAIKTGDDFKKKSTGASLSLTGEHIDLRNCDGDGLLRTTADAGIGIRTPRMGISMKMDNGTLIEGSRFGLHTEHVDISTSKPSKDGKMIESAGSVRIASKDIKMEAVDYEQKGKTYTEKQLAADSRLTITSKTIEVGTTNPTGVEHDDKGKVTKGEYKAEGDVIIRSKTVAVETLDYEVKDGKLSPKTLTKDSRVTIRSEKMDMQAVDTEGKATGSITMNAKAVSAKSMDVDKEKLTDKSLAAGSTMLLVSEKMYVGAKSKDVKSKKLQAVSEDVGLFADNTLEAQQGDGKAVVQLTGGNASLSGSKSQVYGDTTINAKTEVKGELKAPKATIDHVEAKTSFKSPNITDGMSTPGGGGGGSLSTKLKTEDIKE